MNENGFSEGWPMTNTLCIEHVGVAVGLPEKREMMAFVKLLSERGAWWGTLAVWNGRERVAPEEDIGDGGKRWRPAIN